MNEARPEPDPSPPDDRDLVPRYTGWHLTMKRGGTGHTFRTGRKFRDAGCGAAISVEPERVYWKAQARMLTALKRAPCTDCGMSFDPVVMDLDHREPATKRYTVSRMIGRAGHAKIMAEVAKCDIVCANWHRDGSYRRRRAGSSERE